MGKPGGGCYSRGAEESRTARPLQSRGGGALLAFGNSRGAEGLKWSGVRHGVEDGDLGKIIHGSLWAMEKTWDFVPFFLM